MTSDLEPGLASHAGVESFDAFYRRQRRPRRPLITLAYAISGSRLAAEDLAQEALVAAYQSWDEIKQKDNPGTWVRRILINKAASFHRRRLTELKVLARHPFDRNQIAFPEVTGDLDRIWSQVRRLPPRQKQIIALTHVEGMSQVEIADLLGISKESVNTHMRRARQTLARRLGIEE